MTDQTSTLQRELRQRRPFRSTEQEAALSILRTADALHRRLAEVVAPHDLTPQQYNVLRILRGAQPDPLPTLEIGERLIERVPGVTRLLDRLEEKGLVRRERGSVDRRLVHCWITPKGLELLAESDPAMNEAGEAAVRGLPKTDVAKLIQLLEHVRRRVDPTVK